VALALIRRILVTGNWILLDLKVLNEEGGGGDGQGVRRRKKRMRKSSVVMRENEEKLSNSPRGGALINSIMVLLYCALHSRVSVHSPICVY
jgi:hypothetical protein